MKQILKQIGPDAAAVVLFLAIAFAYFFTPISHSLVLNGHDTVASIGQGKELTDYHERTGETSRWTGAMFSGMPTYQISPSYEATEWLVTLRNVYSLGTAGVLSYLFLYLLGFYILLRAFGCKSWLAAAGSVAWAFSSYFLIIIAAGHIWKVMTLCFIPPTIAGLVLCYRGKLLWGGVVTALFTALQILSNHIQMSYYFLFVMAAIVACYGIGSLWHRQAPADAADGLPTPRQWLRATAVVALAGLTGVLANLPNLYHTYTYSQQSLRGKAELTPLTTAASANTGGLDRDYITAWSYGVDETMTLLVPEYKGGGSRSILEREGIEEVAGYDDFYNHAAQLQQAMADSGQQGLLPGMYEYWGDQPFTVGPVYVGAIVCFLFVLGLFVVRGPMKWALLLSTLLSLLFAWGKNLMPVTDFFIDHLPMYSKFRTVSSALVIAELTMPLLAVLCLAHILRHRDWLQSRRNRTGLAIAGLSTAGVCLLLWLAPSVAGRCLSADDAHAFATLAQMGLPQDFIDGYSGAITAIHHHILSQSALRSLLFIAAAMLVMAAWQGKVIRGWMMAAALGALCLGDLWAVDKRYLGEDNFSEPEVQLAGFEKTPADIQILADTDLSYRVCNLGAGNPFNETSNATSYYHKSIGGYHAAKLHRYQDLIDRQLNRELPAFAGAINLAGGDLTQVKGDSIAPVLNMLNTKYFLFGRGEAALAVCNPYANGNAWFVDTLTFVGSADEEMKALTGLDTKHKAVADRLFKEQLDGTPLDKGTATLTRYEPNELHYDVQSGRGGLMVCSEIYYPGWTATIDGEEAVPGRVNYVLRALKIPAGQHKVVFTFRPASLRLTNGIAYAAIALIVIGLILALWQSIRPLRRP